MKSIIIQISSGQGPEECCRVVAKVQEMLIRQAKQLNIQIEVLENIKGELNGTLRSAILLAKAEELSDFTKEWRGSVLWIAKSPYRSFHKRKNWFVGVEIFESQEKLKWNPKEITIETLRASGPGGQNVNKVESAVRATHKPSGLQVLAMDTRSQLQNKKLCLERLEKKVMAWQTSQLIDEQQLQWQNHANLSRGNPMKTITANL
ncbi:peptide chain release factor [Pedobacter cryoconitis]|uniref:peptide chain release factor H n=1 Tax=Pedobacter cryoconitis TaxID=188932 RepID=UPI0016144E83|nr:peptide chain release factor H [Pedobacter cryoconitis]MBB6273793.1 peptide chain release factor [Pedobacter cryoconitis]